MAAAFPLSTNAPRSGAAVRKESSRKIISEATQLEKSSNWFFPPTKHWTVSQQMSQVTVIGWWLRRSRRKSLLQDGFSRLCNFIPILLVLLTAQLSTCLLHFTQAWGQSQSLGQLWTPRTQQRVDTQQILKNRIGAVQSSVAEEKISSKAACYSANNNNTSNCDSHLSSCYAPDFSGSASVLLCSLRLLQLSAVPLNPSSRKLRLTQVYYWKQNVQWLNSIAGIFTRTGIKPFLDHAFG